MTDTKNFPIDYTKDEIIDMLSELTLELTTKSLTEGAKNNIERKITVCQNQLVFLTLIESNNKLAKHQELLFNQQATLVDQQTTLANLFTESSVSSKRTAKEAKIIIALTIFTILITSIIEIIHMVEENHNQKKIIKQIELIINNGNNGTEKRK